MDVFSKWLDYELSQLLHLTPAYLKDSFTLLEDFDKLLPLPEDAKIFTADAVGMYTNIHLPHAKIVFECWFVERPNEIPSDFPKEMFLTALDIVIPKNVFQFGNTYWQQTDGAAMGTSSAIMFATLYYALHERTSIPQYLKFLIYYKRYIDDILGIWTGPATSWPDFYKSLDNYGKLCWKASKLNTLATFFDLNIKINPTT